MFLLQENKILPKLYEVLDGKVDRADVSMKITNEDRTFGALLSYHVSK